MQKLHNYKTERLTDNKREREEKTCFHIDSRVATERVKPEILYHQFVLNHEY